MGGRSGNWWRIGLGVVALVALGAGLVKAWRTPSRVVAVVDLAGALTSSRAAVETLESTLDERRIAAVVVRVDSPGGDVAVAQDIFDAIERVRLAGKPVVAAIGSMGASGGFYAALAAQEIWVQPGSLTGSIGVIYERLDASGLAAKLGVSREALTAGAYKDAGSFWRRPTAAETDMMRTVLADIYEQFLDVVRTRRHLDPAALAAAADGRIWTGRQAVTLGLADRLGSWRAAARRAAQLAGLPEDTPVEEWGSGGWLGGLTRAWSTQAGPPPIDARTIEWVTALVGPARPRWYWTGGVPGLPMGIP